MLFRDRNFLPLFPHTFEPGRCRASSLLTYTSRSRTSSRSTGDGEGYITLASPPPSPSPPSDDAAAVISNNYSLYNGYINLIN